jgi:hypothetical protein
MVGSGPSTAGPHLTKETPMGSEKHRGAPKKQVKKPSLKAKDKAAKKLASQLGTPLQPRPAAGSGLDTGGGPA